MSGTDSGGKRRDLIPLRPIEIFLLIFNEQRDHIHLGHILQNNVTGSYSAAFSAAAGFERKMDFAEAVRARDDRRTFRISHYHEFQPPQILRRSLSFFALLANNGR